MGKSTSNIKASKRLLDKVGKYYDAEDFKKALDFTNRSIKKDPNNAEAHFVKGNILMAMKKPYKAIQSFNESIALGYRDEVIYTNRGSAFRTIKKINLALADYKSALEINPNFYLAYALRGELFLDEKKYDIAIKDFDSALKINPDHHVSLINKCSAYEQKGNLQKALKVMNEFVLAKDNNVPFEIIINMGHLYSKCGKHENAIFEFSRLIDGTDIFITPYDWRANEFEKIGEFEKAKADRDKVYDLRNNDGVFVEYEYP